MSQASLQETPTRAGWLDRPLIASLAIDWERALYIALIALALFTRLYDVGTRVVSHDESLHTQYSYQYYNGDGFVHTPLMHGPFLFHATAAVYWLFGHDDYTSRIIPALLGTLLVGMPYLMRDWLGRRGALFASFMLLISPYLSYYGRYIRHDMPVIIWAMICFIATLYYLREQKPGYLLWFAGGLSMMFNTKEVSFIYVAIFGSFVLLRLLMRVAGERWFRQQWRRLTRPALVLVVGALLLLGGQLLVSRAAAVAEDGPPATGEAGPIAVDPDAEPTPAQSTGDSSTQRLIGSILRAGGMVVIGVACFLALIPFRRELAGLAEYDLVMLYTTLVLPSVSALLIVLAGVNPRDTTLRVCELAGQETMSAWTLFFSRAVTPTCIAATLGSPLMISIMILIFTLIVSVALGWWWGGRRWIAPAVVFYTLFTLLFTSLFTNSGGMFSGLVGSLGYWLEQHGVQRGSQPLYYYLVVTPFYEFLPLIFAWLGGRLWLRRLGLLPIVGPLVGGLLLGWLAYSYVDWLFNRTIPGPGLGIPAALAIGLLVAAAGVLAVWTRVVDRDDAVLGALAAIVNVGALLALVFGLAQLDIANRAIDPTTGAQIIGATRQLPGILAAVGVLLLCAAWWYVVQRPRLADALPTDEWRARLTVDALFGIVPSLIWWTLLAWAIYSIAGEKMPWLSTHLTLPMCLLAGWYLGQQVRTLTAADFFNRRTLTLLGLALLALLTGFLTLQTALVRISWGSDTLRDLTLIGTLIGRLVVLAAIVAFFVRLAQGVDRALLHRVWLLASFAVLSLLTIRFMYLANYVNGDYATEFLVYAHGSPATKQQVMRQIEEVSLRMEGDRSIRIAFDNKSSWPYYWYLRDFPNATYFGENPTASITDAPIILAGSQNWNAVDAIVRDAYEYDTYSYIWWPMEEYRNISWRAITGVDGDPATQRGLGNRAVREALWSIFFYRDYVPYGEVFGGNYALGDWPLRSDLRLYIRKDVLGRLWDSGIAAAAYEPPVDPYAGGAIAPATLQTFGGVAGSGPGQLFNPRNVAVGADGRVYVADTGNHRIQVFNPDGSFAFGFGSFGSEPGQFNEPWGIAVDDTYLYVADTWNGRVQKFTQTGDFVTAFGRFDVPAAGATGELLFYGPRSVALGPDDTLLIMDTGNHRIQVTDRDGNFLRQMGSDGFQPGQFSEPVGLAVAADSGSVYVAEAWNRRIQQLTRDLQPFYDWQIDAWDGTSLDNKPYIAVDGRGYILASDPEGYRILVFNTIGEYVARFGEFGSGPAQLNLPTGIAVDAQDNVYVADTRNNRIVKYAPVEPGSVEATGAEGENQQP